MADRASRFVGAFHYDREPLNLLKLFGAQNLEDLMKIAKNYATDFETLQQEAYNYMGKRQVQECVTFAADQSKLPIECAFAIHAYTRKELYHELNKLLRSGQDLEEFRNVCICMIKGLALLPTYQGKVYRGVTKEQLQNV